LARKFDGDSSPSESDENWIHDLKRLSAQKLATSDDTGPFTGTGSLKGLQSVFKIGEEDKGPVDFGPFVFDKEQEVYLQNRKPTLTTNNLKCMVQAFKARIQELNENIDEDFILNIKDKIIPDHDFKMNEFLEEAELYLRNVNNKAEHKTFYLENYVYNKVY
jgi:hypothetical protein